MCVCARSDGGGEKWKKKQQKTMDTNLKWENKGWIQIIKHQHMKKPNTTKRKTNW